MPYHPWKEAPGGAPDDVTHIRGDLLQKSCQLATGPALAGQAALLADGLAHPANITQLQMIAVLLPGFCCAGFECPLDDDAPGLDYLHCLRRAQEGGFLTAAFAGRRLGRFGALWCEGARGLDRIPNCWLEFDLRHRADVDIPEPSLFVNIPATDPATYDETIEQVGRALGLRRGPATRAAMARMYRGLGPIAAACETGFWLARPTATVRMVFTKLQETPERLIDRLAVAGHPDPSLLRRVPVPALWPTSGSVSIAVDVADQVAPGCAVELYPLAPDRAFPLETLHAAQARLFTTLVDVGLCTAQRRARIARWPGRVCLGSDPDLDVRLWLRRGINHVKLTIKPGRPVSAKAYLSLTGVAVKQERMPDAPA